MRSTLVLCRAVACLKLLHCPAPRKIDLPGTVIRQKSYRAGFAEGLAVSASGPDSPSRRVGDSKLCKTPKHTPERRLGFADNFQE